MDERQGTETMQTFSVWIDDPKLDFARASAMAQQMVREVYGDVLLLAWFDRKARRASPEVPECQHQPAWVAYAVSRGATLRVVVNDGDFVFLFRPVEE